MKKLILLFLLIATPVHAGSFTFKGAATAMTGLSDINTATPTSGNLLIADGTDWESVNTSGDIDITYAGVTSIAASAVGTAELADINSATATTGKLLVGTGTKFDSISINELTEDSGFTSGDFIPFWDTGSSTMDKVDYDDLPSGSGASDLDGLSDVNSATATSGRILMANGSEFHSIGIKGDLTSAWDGTFSIGSGKVGATEIATGGVGTAELADINSATATNGNILVADGNDFGAVAMSGDITITRAGVATIGTGKVGTDEIATDGVGAAEIVADGVGTSELADINSATATAGRMLVSNGSDFHSVDFSGDGDLTAAGVFSLGTNSVGTDELSDINSATITNGNIFVANGVDFHSVAMSGEATINRAGSIALTTTAITGQIEDSGFTSGDFVMFFDTSENRLNKVDYDNLPSGGASDLDGLSDVNSATATAGRMLIADGADFHSVAMGGDATITQTGSLQLVADAVTSAEIVADGVGTDEINGIGTLTATLGNLLVNDGTDFKSVTMSGNTTINSSGAVALASDSVGTSELDGIATLTQTLGNMLITDGTDFQSVAMGGDATISSTGSLYIGAGKVGTAEIATDGVGSVEIVADAVGTAELADINSATATAGNIFVANGSDFHSVAMGGIATIQRDGIVIINPDGNIVFTFDGGGSAITTGEKTWTQIPNDFTITSVETTADSDCNISIDFWSDSYANFAPDNNDSICDSGTCPTLSGADKSQDTSLTSWTTSLGQWTYIKANVDSVSTCERSVVSFQGEWSQQ